MVFLPSERNHSIQKLNSIDGETNPVPFPIPLALCFIDCSLQCLRYFKGERAAEVKVYD